MVRSVISLSLALCTAVVLALIRPGLVVRWLSRQFPDVLFRLQTTEPLVALSFDDAPHSTLTPRILDVLAEHEARATFFVIGEHVPGNEAILRRLVDEGHELANHLMSDTSSKRLPAAEFERQIRQTHALLAPFGPASWLRPGHGWFDRRMLDQIHRHHYRCAMASTYALEFLPVPAPLAARHILLNTSPGAVIVLHDGASDRERTVEVLRLILPALRRRGFRVVTLSELSAVGERSGPALTQRQVAPAQP